ncbi:MAG: alpha/beta fold hydrolase [Candidatus Neomarinimicrobiota bacterium]
MKQSLRIVSVRALMSVGLVIFAVLNLIGCRSKTDISVTEGRARIGSAEIYYKIVGSGTPTFILHGGPGDTHDTMLQLQDLADQYRLIFYDQRAAGRSTGDADTANHTVEQFVEDLEQLRQQLAPEKINLIGGSWGALLALQYAMKYSENISSLVIMSTTGIRAEAMESFSAIKESRRTTADSLALEEIFASDGFQRRLPESWEKFWRVYFRSYCYNPTYADSIHLWLRDTTWTAVPGRYAGLGRFFRNYDLAPGLNRITCPTLIIYGDYDMTPLEWVRPIADGIPGARLEIVPNAGHWVWVEATDQVTTLIREFFTAQRP